MTWLLVVVILALIACSVVSTLMQVPAYTAVLLENRISGSVRSIGPGIHFIFPWEKIVPNSETVIKKSSHLFPADFETKNHKVISLKVAFDLIPDVNNLRGYIAFDERTRIAGITERIKSILSNLIREMKDREEVMAKFKEIGPRVKDIFEQTLSEDGKRLEYYYGIDLKVLMIPDVELPKELKEASIRQEATKKDNETRKLEMTNMKKMAMDLVKASGGTMPLEVAMEIMQLQFGKGNVKKELHRFGLDRGTQEMVLKFLEKIPELINAFRS
ncbi:MAG: hypothetical protein HZB99_04470 [Candidatus Harrisonbacteria bacterium]|nr:hypothetical protein [Candidatus Harrisonbacteria bacterium]